MSIAKTIPAATNALTRTTLFPLTTNHACVPLGGSISPISQLPSADSAQILSRTVPLVHRTLRVHLASLLTSQFLPVKISAYATLLASTSRVAAFASSVPS